MIFLERTREGHCQSDECWGGTYMGFSERIDTILNWSRSTQHHHTLHCTDPLTGLWEALSIVLFRSDEDDVNDDATVSPTYRTLFALSTGLASWASLLTVWKNVSDVADSMSSSCGRRVARIPCSARVRAKVSTRPRHGKVVSVSWFSWKVSTRPRHGKVVSVSWFSWKVSTRPRHGKVVSVSWFHLKVSTRPKYGMVVSVSWFSLTPKTQCSQQKQLKRKLSQSQDWSLVAAYTKENFTPKDAHTPLNNNNQIKGMGWGMAVHICKQTTEHIYIFYAHTQVHILHLWGKNGNIVSSCSPQVRELAKKISFLLPFERTVIKSLSEEKGKPFPGGRSNKWWSCTVQQMIVSHERSWKGIYRLKALFNLIKKMCKYLHTNQWHKNTWINILIHTKHGETHTHTFVWSCAHMYTIPVKNTHTAEDTEEEAILV